MMKAPPVPEHDLPQIVKLLISAGHAAPSADNMQPWRFHWRAGNLSVRYQSDDATRKVFGVDTHCEHLTMGAVCENLIQASASANLGVDWQLNPEGPEYLSGTLDPGVPVPDALKEHALFKRHTNRLAYRKEPIGDELLRSIASLFEGECHPLVITDPGRIAEIAGLVELASRLRFRTREIHEWFGHVLRFSEEQVAGGTGLDVATIDLPPGGRLLLRFIRDWKRLSLVNRIGMYKLLARIEAAKVKNSGAIVAVLGPSGNASEIAAGRLMERAWILFNENGVAVQPFYVVTDLTRRVETGRMPPALLNEATVLKERADALLAGGGSVHMLLRVGVPQRQPTRSRRLPSRSVYSIT